MNEQLPPGWTWEKPMTMAQLAVVRWKGGGALRLWNDGTMDVIGLALGFSIPVSVVTALLRNGGLLPNFTGGNQL